MLRCNVSRLRQAVGFIEVIYNSHLRVYLRNYEYLS